MTYEGGLNTDGNVFSIDTNGTAFKDLADFAGSGTSIDGSSPDGDVILSGNTLYGMTEVGGNSDSGCIFSLDTTGVTYTNLFDFTNATGYIPYSNVTLSGNIMYGTASAGGPNGYGVVFRFHYVNSGINNITNNESAKLYPNPNSGEFLIHTSKGSGASVIEVYNVPGEMIFSANLPSGQTNCSINLGSQPSGIYFYRVLSDKEALISDGKFIIEK
jgi:uncharacterized repeat protein (TIGR03803 family)